MSVTEVTLFMLTLILADGETISGKNLTAAQVSAQLAFVDKVNSLTDEPYVVAVVVESQDSETHHYN